jgi:hypothetical protein
MTRSTHGELKKYLQELDHLGDFGIERRKIIIIIIIIKRILKKLYAYCIQLAQCVE